MKTKVLTQKYMYKRLTYVRNRTAPKHFTTNLLSAEYEASLIKLRVF